MEMVIVCPICRQQNPSNTENCSSCWTSLANVDSLAKETAESLQNSWRLAAKRKRIFIWGAIVLALLLMVVWTAYINFGAGLFVNQPTSDIGVVPSTVDWPMVQRDPGHQAFIEAESTAIEGNLKWSFKTDGPIFSSPAVVDGQLYLSTGDGRILALDASSGDVIWEHKVNAPVNSSPAVAGNLVYVGLRDGRLIALDKNSGDKEWEFETGQLLYSSPAIYQGVLYVGSGDGRFYALDALGGGELWSYLTDGRVMSGPAVNDEVVVFLSDYRHLYLLDRESGRHRLDFPLSVINGSATLDSAFAYVANESGQVSAFDLAKRELPLEKAARRFRFQMFAWGWANTLPAPKGHVWSSRFGGENFVGTPVVANDAIYIGSTSGTFFAIDKRTGEEIWTFEDGTSISASPSVLGDTVFVGDEDGSIHAIDVTTGLLRWNFEADGSVSSTPVLANEMLYFATIDGTLYAIE